ncbi:MAG: uroporphyrinogen-III synthase [Burkholderiaceae bacterium]
MGLGGNTPMRRVIVTRPVDEDADSSLRVNAAQAMPSWLEALRAHGFDAQALPLLHIAALSGSAALADLARAREQVAAYRAVMFVSPAAVRHFFSPKTAFFESNWPIAKVNTAGNAINLEVWATGPGTVQALCCAGVPATQIRSPAPDAAQFDSASLWQQVAAAVQPGQRFLIVRGAGATAAAGEAGAAVGNDWLAQQVLAAGAQVDEVAAYQRGAPQWDAAQAALARQAAVDGSVWLLSSSEATGHLANLLPGQDWRQARAVATHSRIAEAARQLGFGVVRESRPVLAALVASIESFA